MTTPPTKRPPEPINEEEESDFQTFVRNAREFLEDHGTTLMIVILALVLGFFGWNWYSGREVRALETAHAELAMAETPAAKQDVARRHARVPGVASIAYLDAADLLLLEALRLPVQFGAEARELTEQERTETLERAGQLYRQAADMNFSDLHVVNAQMGLAAVAENLGDWEAAAEHYDRAVEAAGDRWPALAGKARSLREDLDRVAQAVRFPTAPAPTLDDSPALQDDGGFRLNLNALPEDGELGGLPLQLPDTPQQEADDAVPLDPIVPDDDEADEDAQPEAEIELPLP